MAQAENPKSGTNQANLLRYATNPRAYTLKKWFSDILKDKFSPHENIVERVSTSLVTDRDTEEFGKLIMQVYECAYLHAVSDYKEQAEKLGFKIKINDKPIS